MTDEQQITALDKPLKDISFRFLIALVVITATVVTTVLTAYFSTKTDIEVMRTQITQLSRTVERMEGQRNDNIASNQPIK